jgi:tetratricopeptide (TPR) repeat protein
MNQSDLRARLALVLILPMLFLGCSTTGSFLPTSLPGRSVSNQAEASYLFLKYLELLQNQDYPAALQALDKAAAKDPSPELSAEQALFHYRYQDDIQAGLAAVNQGLERFPDSRRLTMTGVDLYLKDDQTEAAAALLHSYLKSKPRDVQAVSRLSELYLQQDKASQALDRLKAIPDKRRTAEIHFRMAQAFADLEERDKAISHLRTATEMAPSMLQAWAELAYQYEMAKDFVAAQKTYSKLLDMGLDNPDIRLRLIELHLKLNNPGQALQQAQALPADEKLLIKAGSLFVQNNFYAEAERLLQNLADGTISDKSLYLRAIIAYRGHKDKRSALQFLERIDQGSSLHSDSLSLQCQLLFKMGRNEQARQTARKGQSLYPDMADFWLLESDILRSQEKYGHAISLLKQARKPLPKNTSILFQLGFLEHERGNPERALGYMERIIQINPDHAQALNFVGYTLTEEGRDLDRALILIQKALEMEPDNGYFLDSLAWLYYKTDELEQAWETINRAVASVKEDPVMWDHYGDIARSMDKLGQARKAYQRALKLDPPNPDQIQLKLDSLPVSPNKL